MQVTFYELLPITQVKSYFLHASYELLFITCVASYFLYKSYKLLLIARVTNYFLHTSNYYLLQEVQVNFYIGVTNYYLLHKWDCNVDSLKFLYYANYLFLWPALCKTSYSYSAIPEQCISWMSNVKLLSPILLCEIYLHFYELFLTSSSISR